MGNKTCISARTNYGLNQQEKSIIRRYSDSTSVLSVLPSTGTKSHIMIENGGCYVTNEFHNGNWVTGEGYYLIKLIISVDQEVKNLKTASLVTCIVLKMQREDHKAFQYCGFDHTCIHSNMYVKINITNNQFTWIR